MFVKTSLKTLTVYILTMLEYNHTFTIDKSHMKGLVPHSPTAVTSTFCSERPKNLVITRYIPRRSSKSTVDL